MTTETTTRHAAGCETCDAIRLAMEPVSTTTNLEALNAYEAERMEWIEASNDRRSVLAGEYYTERGLVEIIDRLVLAEIDRTAV